MKNNILTILLAATISSATAQQKIVFKGEVTDNYPGHSVYLYNNILGITDSAKVSNGKFEIAVPYQHASRYLFYSSYDTKVKKGYAPFGILVEKPGTIGVKVALEKGFGASKITNAPAHALYEKISTQLETSKDPAKDLTQFCLANSQSYAAVFVLDRMGDAIEPNERLLVYRKLSTALQNSYEGKRVLNKINGELGSKTGAMAPLFTLKDQQGKDVSLEQFKGKYVFIDFWASWCGPCREEFPHIKEAYEKYKSKGFEVIGISTDKSKSSWTKAINDLNLPWVHLLDAEGDQAIALSKYAVSVLPTSFLLDKEGRIIAKDLRGDALEKELKKLLQ